MKSVMKELSGQVRFTNSTASSVVDHRVREYGRETFDGYVVTMSALRFPTGVVVGSAC